MRDDMIKVVKIGGHIIDDSNALEEFLKAFALLEGPKVLIHGGGKLATRMSSKLGVDAKMNAGRRITTDEDLEIVTMVYAGLVNKQIVAKLQSLHCNAMGFSGADADLILSEKRPVQTIDYGWVGDVKTTNDNVLSFCFSNGLTPVCCAITHDGNGQLLNTNADTIAGELAIAASRVGETELVYCFEKKGVLADVNDDDSVITAINHTDFQLLKASGAIHTGMLPKLDNCFNALKKGVNKVIIGNAAVINKPNALFTTISLT